MTEAYYLNNDGSKWVIPGSKVVLIDESRGYQKVRAVEYWEALGNFALAVLKYQGKRIKRFCEDCERIDGLPVIRLKS